MTGADVVAAVVQAVLLHGVGFDVDAGVDVHRFVVRRAGVAIDVLHVADQVDHGAGECGVTRNLELRAVQRHAGRRLEGRQREAVRQRDHRAVGAAGQFGPVRAGRIEVTLELVDQPAAVGKAQLRVAFGIGRHLHRTRIEIEVDQLPGPVRDGFLHVIHVALGRLAPELVPGCAAADEVIGRPVAGLATRVQVMVGTDVQRVLAGAGQYRHGGVAEPLRYVADVLLRLIGPMHDADHPVHIRIDVRGGHHLAQPFGLRGKTGFGIQIDQQHTADLMRVVAFIGCGGDALVADAVVEVVRAPVGQARVVIGFVIAQRGHDGQIAGHHGRRLHVHEFVVIQRADIDLVAVVQHQVHRLFQRLAGQRLDLGLRRLQQRRMAVVVAQLVVTGHQNAEMTALARCGRLGAEAEHRRQLAAGAHAIAVQRFGLQAGQLYAVQPVGGRQRLGGAGGGAVQRAAIDTVFDHRFIAFSGFPRYPDRVRGGGLQIRSDVGGDRAQCRAAAGQCQGSAAQPACQGSACSHVGVHPEKDRRITPIPHYIFRRRRRSRRRPFGSPPGGNLRCDRDLAQEGRHASGCGQAPTVSLHRALQMDAQRSAPAMSAASASTSRPCAATSAS